MVKKFPALNFDRPIRGFMLVKNNSRWFLWLISLSLFLAACETLDEAKTYSKSGLTINFLHINRIEHEIDDYQIDHPVKLSTKLAGNHLLSLLYKRENAPGNIQPVFSVKEANKLSPLFQKALARLKLDTYLHFKYQSSRGTTEGEAFGTVGKIHWRFSKINGSIYSSDILNHEPNWKLVRMNGQTLRKVETAFVKIARRNWIVANMNLAYPKRRPKMESSAGASIAEPKTEATGASAKEQLKELKGLLDEGLIDKKEYEQRRVEILNRHF